MNKMGVVARATGLLTVLWLSSAAQAQVVKCLSPGGDVTYTQGGCPPGTKPHDESAGGKSTAAEARTRPDAGSTDAVAGAEALSSRAQQMFKLHQTCTKSLEKLPCGEWHAAKKHCLIHANWETADCAALREAMAVVDAKTEQQARARQADLRGKCAQGDKLSCASMHCTDIELSERPPARLRECMRSPNLRSSAVWVQIEEVKEPTRWLGKFVCLQKVASRGELGEQLSLRPTVTVNRQNKTATRAAHYASVVTGEQEFPSVELAATAACASAVRLIEQRAAAIR